LAPTVVLQEQSSRLPAKKIFFLRPKMLAMVVVVVATISSPSVVIFQFLCNANSHEAAIITNSQKAAIIIATSIIILQALTPFTRNLENLEQAKEAGCRSQNSSVITNM
jgi:hypothetical protein